MAGQCLFFSFFCYTYRAVPSWDRKKIEMLKGLFYQIIVHSKYGLKGEETKFDFKYVPEYETITQLGECEEDKNMTSGVESRNRNTFLIGVAVFGIGTWITFKIAGGVLRSVW